MEPDSEPPAFAKMLIQLLKDGLPKLVTTKPAEPETFFHEMNSKLDKAVDQMSERERAELLESIVHPTQDQEFRSSFSKATSKYEQDPRCKALLELVARAEARVPLGFMEEIAIQFQPPKLVRFIEVLEPLEEARKSSGEAKARALKRALENAGEYLYKPFLNTVWTLTCRARGDAPAPPSTLGHLIAEIRPRLPQNSPLLDPDAGWLRNGAAHGNWKYHPDQDSVEVWDEHHPAVKFAVSELLERIEAWAVLSVKILWAVMQDYLGKNLSALRESAAVEFKTDRKLQDSIADSTEPSRGTPSPDSPGGLAPR